ncbi:uncharacterized protein LOC127249361 [Andrographis paniculata]|uniref:uncharacterized protein LOC127249361 n=1 Tax=Andrographis paniculata TaxID=175694 RepID=UPI0021E8E019|nr:uncharacterized protein LOC127249361 [Andrographis paniculata]
MSPPPSFHTSKEQTQRKNTAAAVEDRKSARATSAPRPRAVLSSPENDLIIGRKKSHARKEQLPGLENRNRHAQCKILPKSVAFDCSSPARGYNKELVEPRSSIRAKNRASSDSSTKKKDEKKTAPRPAPT